MSKITTDEIVELLKDPESKLIARRILNMLQTEVALNTFLNDLNTAMAKSVDEEERYRLLRALFGLASDAKELLKKDKGQASVW